MNRTRDQLFSRARLALHEDGGIRRRDALDLFEYRFQGLAAADDLLEPALIGLSIPVP
jgi:hypothetical protein